MICGWATFYVIFVKIRTMQFLQMQFKMLSLNLIWSSQFNAINCWYGEKSTLFFHYSALRAWQSPSFKHCTSFSLFKSSISLPASFNLFIPACGSVSQCESQNMTNACVQSRTRHRHFRKVSGPLRLHLVASVYRKNSWSQGMIEQFWILHFTIGIYDPTDEGTEKWPITFRELLNYDFYTVYFKTCAKSQALFVKVIRGENLGWRRVFLQSLCMARGLVKWDQGGTGLQDCKLPGSAISRSTLVLSSMKLVFKLSFKWSNETSDSVGGKLRNVPRTIWHDLNHHLLQGLPEREYEAHSILRL